MNKENFYYYCLLAFLLPCLIFLIFILRDLHKNKNVTYTRTIPYPPKKLIKNKLK